MADTTQAVEEKTEEKPQADGGAKQDTKTQAQSVELSEAAATGNTGAGTSIGILLDTRIPVTVAVGKKDIPIQQLLQLGPGSVLKLDKSIDTPVDLYLKDTRFATGNVVVVENRFAVKIEQILGADAAANQTTA